MTARIVISNTARATIRETWTFTVPDGVTIPDKGSSASLFDLLMHHPDVERDCADEVIGDEEDRDGFHIVEIIPVEHPLADRATPAECDLRYAAEVTCGACGASWCEKCDPAPSALCHYCHGRGYSTAEITPPRVSS
jgi:hypothetical protein